MILGIDEVGRGPWAGPLVMGAVILGGTTIDGLTDSKKLTKKKREELDPIIRSQALGYSLGWVSATELDEIGMSAALELACKRAVQAIDTLEVAYSEIVIDGTINFLQDTAKGKYVKTLAKADLLVPSVSAASIIAKVARDNYMSEQDATYPGYKFSSHSGYGTAAHRAAIEQYGVTPLHRLSFAPLTKYRSTLLPSFAGSRRSLGTGPASESAPTFAPQASTKAGAAPLAVTRVNASPKSVGDMAEDEAAHYLVRHGHEIIERNWKTKYCEIDIVSAKDGVIYFTEVKYRRQANQGGGLAAITPKKLNQMKFAAEVYIKANNIKDANLLLAVASVSGDPPQVEDWFALDD